MYLPLEIVLPIAEILADAGDLRALRGLQLSCQSGYAASTPFLYDHVHILTDRQFALLLRCPSRSRRDTYSLIRRVTLHRLPSDITMCLAARAQKIVGRVCLFDHCSTVEVTAAAVEGMRDALMADTVESKGEMKEVHGLDWMRRGALTSLFAPTRVCLTFPTQKTHIPPSSSGSLRDKVAAGAHAQAEMTCAVAIQALTVWPNAPPLLGSGSTDPHWLVAIHNADKNVKAKWTSLAPHTWVYLAPPDPDVGEDRLSGAMKTTRWMVDTMALAHRMVGPSKDCDRPHGHRHFDDEEGAAVIVTPPVGAGGGKGDMGAEQTGTRSRTARVVAMAATAGRIVTSRVRSATRPTADSTNATMPGTASSSSTSAEQDTEDPISEIADVVSDPLVVRVPSWTFHDPFGRYFPTDPLHAIIRRTSIFLSGIACHVQDRHRDERWQGMEHYLYKDKQGRPRLAIVKAVIGEGEGARCKVCGCGGDGELRDGADGMRFVT